MSRYHNLERPAFRPTEYVGYGYNSVFHVRRDGKGWLASSVTPPFRILGTWGKSLKDISKWLEG